MVDNTYRTSISSINGGAQFPTSGVVNPDDAATPLYGATGIPSFPAAAAPADNVSIAEVLRSIWAATQGTATGENGITTWPTAAAYANAVSLAEVVAYIQDGTRRGTGTTLAANESLADVLYSTNGIVTFPAASAPANGISIAEVLREIYDQADKVAVKAAAVITDGLTLFTIAGGPIEVLALHSVCATANDATESTLQYSHDATAGAATTISAASASLVSAAAGATVTWLGTALSTAPAVTANGAVLSATRQQILQAGIITAVVGVGSTTGTWSHHLRYRPLARGVTVT